MFDLFWVWQKATDGGCVNDQFGLIELCGISLGQWSAVMTAQPDVLQEVLEFVLVDEHMAQQVLNEETYECDF